MLDSGERVTANFLHGKFNNQLSVGDYIVKNQVLGTEDNWGLGDYNAKSKTTSCGGNVHLHTDIADSASVFGFVQALLNGDGGTPDANLDKDDLKVHYGNSAKGVRSPNYYSPDDAFNNHSELLPWLSMSNGQPDHLNYDVYGVANQPVYGSLTLRRTSAKQFKQLGIGGVEYGTNKSDDLFISKKTI